MLIAPLIISFLVPLQLHAHSIKDLVPLTSSLVLVSCDFVVLIGLPNLMNHIPITNNNPELALRGVEKDDIQPRRRKVFIRKMVAQASQFSTK